ncbi:hypothetical protein EAT51_07785 [Pseudoxanthomonas winnipegensis]|uniref:hypothetical protein n=1 Tax=Pseudoxanthomonas winnipegensis TaxID=2480810 RepID=UPI00102D89F1|nr:hypothetical protein [Pseudoxanthomonas winnipegensis]TAA42163.1 hypothetical protein EAT51_07785 [Pseudoxanthomonas winnipegensis]
MAAVILHFPREASVRYDVNTVRRIAERAGMDPRLAVNEFVRCGYSRAYLTELSERVRQVRMAAPQLPGGAA